MIVARIYIIYYTVDTIVRFFYFLFFIERVRSKPNASFGAKRLRQFRGMQGKINIENALFWLPAAYNVHLYI